MDGVERDLVEFVVVAIDQRMVICSAAPSMSTIQKTAIRPSEAGSDPALRSRMDEFYKTVLKPARRPNQSSSPAIIGSSPRFFSIASGIGILPRKAV